MWQFNNDTETSLYLQGAFLIIVSAMLFLAKSVLFGSPSQPLDTIVH